MAYFISIHAFEPDFLIVDLYFGLLVFLSYDSYNHILISSIYLILFCLMSKSVTIVGGGFSGLITAKFLKLLHPHLSISI